MENYNKTLELQIQSALSTELSNSNCEISTFEFESDSYKILPGIEDYYCKSHDIKMKKNFSFHTEVGRIKDNVHIQDIFVEENRHFKYHILHPKGIKESNKVIFLFHGFNEKTWDKYLPWAQTICENTGKSVVLFPIAFHMQRAPKYWSSKREMFALSRARRNRFPHIVHSTLSNVAISMRLHAMPQRFIWSGLQTYYDAIDFIELCKSGNHPFILADFEFDVFAYSIGGLLAQILKLTNHKNYFDKTKVCLFCSGATFNRLSPVSKFILDSEANVALYSYLVEHFDKFLKKDNIIKHYIEEDHIEGKVFHSMLDYQKMRNFRENLLKKHEDNFYAITLKKDDVIPPFEVINTLLGAYRDIKIKVEEIDFDREYTHENPFPENQMHTEQLKADYKLVFDKVCAFLK